MVQISLHSITKQTIIQDANLALMAHKTQEQTKHPANSYVVPENRIKSLPPLLSIDTVQLFRTIFTVPRPEHNCSRAASNTRTAHARTNVSRLLN